MLNSETISYFNTQVFIDYFSGLNDVGMRIPRIFTDQTLNPHTELQLGEQASHHIAKVLRMQKGRELILFNGLGGEFQASIILADKKKVTVSVGDFNAVNRHSSLQTELAIAISKGDRMEWVIQKATELGIHKIVPLQSEHSHLKLNSERAAKKRQQWQQISISACEQCARNIVPIITNITPLHEWINTVNADKKLVLHHRSHGNLADGMQPESIALLIGPEGGLSETEIQLALDKDFEALTLGPRVLRTETAPLTALSIIQHQWGDF